MTTNVTAADLDRVIKWLYYDKEVRIHDMTWFCANYVYFMLALVVASKFIESVILPTFLRNFRENYSQRDVRNMVTYILEVVVTSGCFYLNVTSGIKIVQQVHTNFDFEMHRLMLVILSCLYIYELFYRLDMNFQLFLHHVITIIFVVVGLEAAYVTRDSKFMAGSVILALTATTEQATFIALFLYRIKHKYAGFALRTSAMQTLIFKLFLMYVCMSQGLETVYHPVRLQNPYGVGWYIVWRYLLYIAVPTLLVTQVYGAFVMWKIGASRRLMSDSAYKKEAERDAYNAAKHIKNA